MRTRIIIAYFATFCYFAVSCDLQEPVRPDIKYSAFYVETEQPTQAEPGTKTFADENGMVLWVNGDLVSVFEKKSYATKYRYDGGTGTTGGVLTEVPESSTTTGTALNHYYAVYPYETFNGLDNSENLILKIHNNQTWDYCSFGPGDNLMVAVADDNHFQFKNVGGYIVLRLYGEGSVSSITLQGNNNEILAGDVKVTASIGSDPTVAMQKGSRYTTYKSVTLQCDDPVELTGSTKDTPVEFWFVIPATTFTRGLSFVVTDPDGNTFTKTTDKEIAVIRSHSKPLKTEVDFTASMKVAFADANFKAYCVENFDTDGDGEISHAEAKEVTNINIDTENIASLEGIAYFDNLTVLICDGTSGAFGQLTELDLSHNTALTSLDCRNNQIKSLDLSNNVELMTLYCDANELTFLGLSNNPALTDLSCSYNQLTSLDLRNNVSLEYFNCCDNRLSSLDVSKNTLLKELYCLSNQLVNLELSHNTALTSMRCAYNELTSLDVSRNTALTELNCRSNHLTSLDVSHNTALVELNCCSNEMTSLDVSQNSVLIDLRCFSNPPLREIWLKTGQTISTFDYDTDVATIKYKD